MKNMPEGENLRRSVSGRGKTLAVLEVSGGRILEAEPGISLVRGAWDGEPAVAIIASPESSSLRAGYVSDLRALHEISFELSLCQGIHEVCREAVRLGYEKLSFDRLGIWLVDQNDPRWKLGTWGIDEKGKLRDERGARLKRIKMRDVPASFYEGREPLFFKENSPCRDHEGRVVGRGSKLLAPLWDGHKLIGELSVDYLLRHEGFSPEKREAFVIFSRVIAHLVSLKRAEAELKQLASTDSLTGTVNRRTALIMLEKHIAQCRRSGSMLTLCLVDLDGLKRVNDDYGHAAGDDYIRQASSALVRAVRGSDTVGRIGGDEFLIIFPDCRGEVVVSIMERVNAEMASGASQARAGSASYARRLSWGIAFLGEIPDGSGIEGAGLQRCADALIELADQRMYDNKRSKGSTRPRAPGEIELAF
jgi:diguanylate cyclase (GGDEF)-like protein